MEILPLYECGSLPKFLQLCRASSLPDGSRRPPASPADGSTSTSQAPATLAAPWLKVIALSLEESSVPLTELFQSETSNGQLSATSNEGAPHYLIVMGMGSYFCLRHVSQCCHSNLFAVTESWALIYPSLLLPLCRQRKRRRAAQRARTLRPVDLYRQPTRCPRH
jgi:hypothetical protein